MNHARIIFGSYSDLFRIVMGCHLCLCMCHRQNFVLICNCWIVPAISMGLQVVLVGELPMEFHCDLQAIQGSFRHCKWHCKCCLWMSCRWNSIVRCNYGLLPAASGGCSKVASCCGCIGNPIFTYLDLVNRIGVAARWLPQCFCPQIFSIMVLAIFLLKIQKRFKIVFFRSGVEIWFWSYNFRRDCAAFCNSVSADCFLLAAARLLRAVAAMVILFSFAAGSRSSYWSGCMQVATVTCQQIFHFRAGNFPFKHNLEKCFTIFFFALASRSGLELQFWTPLRVVVLWFATQFVQDPLLLFSSVGTKQILWSPLQATG